MKKEKILVLDFGGQYAQLVARKLRQLGAYSEVRPYNTNIDTIKAEGYKGVIIKESGFEGNYTCSFEIKDLKIPMLEVPYSVSLLNYLEGDKIKSFIFEACKLKADWNMGDFVKEAVENIKSVVGDKKALCAMSGGVDSSVCALLMHRAIGKNLTCIFVDHGLLRKNEVVEVENVFRQKFDMNFIKVDAGERFLSKLKGVTDPEEKRRIIGEEFIRVFEEEAKKIGHVDYLVQGTIYPDVIESGIGETASVKSHHNVGGLPKNIDFKEIIEPVRNLFKNEVRMAGVELGLPEEMVWRQPFPGPGLAVRVIDDITYEKLETLRDADAIFREEIKNAGLARDINQYFAILTGMRSVGVKNEKRTYDYTVALRAVLTTDFMTADFARIPYEVLEKVSERIVKEVNDVNRVVYDITKKPPATIEWE